MDQGPLVTEQIEAGARFLAEFQNQYPVQAAFWLKDSEHGNWSLYVASEQITDDNFDLAYGEVVRIAGELKDPWFDLFQVRVIGAEGPLAKAAAALQHRYPGRLPARSSGGAFGGVEVDEVYVYPSPLPVAVQ
jgi:hypothetical protein